MKKIVSRLVIIRFLSTLLLAIPAIWLLNTYIPKYKGSIKTIKKNSNHSIVVDLDQDSIPEKIQFENINGNDQLYAEVWSEKGLLLGVWNGTGKLQKETIKCNDIDRDGHQELLFIASDKDSVYLNQLEFKVVNNKLVSTLELKKGLFKNLNKDDYAISFKSELVDVNGDGLLDFLFNLNKNIDIRGLYMYDFVTSKFHKTSLDFMHINDFNVVDNPNTSQKQIIFTTYANCNISPENVAIKIEKFNMDTALAYQYYEDCNSYVGLLNAELKLIGKPLIRKGFTSMFRANAFESDNGLEILSLESYLDQIDSLQTLKILNQNLTVLKERRLKLPINLSHYNKYNAKIFHKTTLDGQARFLFVGLGDSIYEVNVNNLSINYLMSCPEITENCKIREFDLDRDSINEIIFCCNNGLYIFKQDLTDGFFISSEVEMDFSKPFVYTYFKEKEQGVQVIANRNRVVIQYALNTLYHFKYLLMIIVFAAIYLILFIPQHYQAKKLLQENLKLGKLVEERTLEVVQQKNLIELKHKEITDSINYAERIQRSFLATKELLNEHLTDYFVLFQPKDVVSGDFYWATKLKNDRFLLATADSTGHGVPGAIMSILNISSLEKSVDERHLLEPSEILNQTRSAIIERLKKDGSQEGGKDGMDCSLISFDFKNLTLTYASANNPIWIIRDNQLLEFNSDKMPVGKHDKDMISFKQQTVNLQSKDLVYTLTDGLPDQFGGPKGKKFMYKQLKELLLNIAHLPMSHQKETLMFRLNEWKGNLEQVDDICVIGIRV